MANNKTSFHRTPLNIEQARTTFPTLTSVSLQGHREKVQSVAWNCSGSKLASGSADKTIRLWSLDANIRSDRELRGHDKGIDQLCWNPTSDYGMASASSDKTVRIWDIRSNSAPKTVSTPGENIFISWSPDSNYIAVGNKEDVISIIDTRTYRNLHPPTKFSFEVNEVKWDPSTKFLYLTTGTGQLEIMHFPSMKKVCSVSTHTSNCYCLSFDPSGQYFAIGSADSLVSLWDADNMICLRTFGRLDNPVRTLSFSFDSQYIASGSEDRVVDISHVATGESVFSLNNSPAAVSSHMNSVAWHPSAYLLACAGDEVLSHSSSSRTSALFTVFGFS